MGEYVRRRETGGSGDLSTALLKADNLADLADPAAARTSLGLGAAATKSMAQVAADPALLGTYGRRGASVVVSASNTQNGTAADYVCTGTADQDTIMAAIASLPTAGGKVLLRAGQYNLTAPVVIARDNVTLEGEGFGFWGQFGSGNPGTGTEGSGITKLKVTAATAYGIFIDGGINSPAEGRWRGITIRGLYLYGVNNTGTGIVTSASGAHDQVIITECFVHKFGIGMDVKLDAGHISKNMIMDCSGNGLVMRGDTYTTVYDNCIADIGGDGIVLSGGSEYVITGNVIVRTAKGIYVAATVTDVMIANNKLNGCRSHGIHTLGSGTMVQGCDIRNGTGGLGIFGDTSHRIQVIGNTITGQTGGEAIGASSGATIYHGVFVGNVVDVAGTAGYDGIHINNMIGGVVQGNMVGLSSGSNAKTGIWVGGTCGEIAVTGNCVRSSWGTKGTIATGSPVNVVGSNVGF